MSFTNIISSGRYVAIDNKARVYCIFFSTKTIHEQLLIRFLGFLSIGKHRYIFK